MAVVGKRIRRVDERSVPEAACDQLAYQNNHRGEVAEQARNNQRTVEQNRASAGQKLRETGHTVCGGGMDQHSHGEHHT